MEIRMKPRTMLKMYAAKKTLVDPVQTMEDLAIVFLAFICVVAEEHPDKIDLYLQATAAATIQQNINHMRN